MSNWITKLSHSNEKVWEVCHDTRISVPKYGKIAKLKIISRPQTTKTQIIDLCRLLKLSFIKAKDYWNYTLPSKSLNFFCSAPTLVQRWKLGSLQSTEILLIVIFSRSSYHRQTQRTSSIFNVAASLIVRNFHVK